MTQPKRRGRPRLDPTDPDPSVHVGLRLPTKQYDTLYQRAREARMSIPAYIRQHLKSTRFGSLK